MSCFSCYRQLDGSIVKIETKADTPTRYHLQDGSITATAPAGFVKTDEVVCSLFTALPTTVAFFEVEDADGNQLDDALVELRQLPDGSTVYIDMATGTEYLTQADYLTAVGGAALVNTEDTDYSTITVQGCDTGISIQRVTTIRDGDPNDVAGTRIETAAGALHTLSGSETWGAFCDSNPDPVRAELCGIITDGDASVDGLTQTTILGGTAYEAPTGPQNNTMDWILSGWSAEAFPIQNPPTAPLTPFGGSTPITTATPGTIYGGGIGQVDAFDPVYVYGKPGSHALSFTVASTSHIEAYQDVGSGTVYDIPFGADPTRQITATIADDSVGSINMWAYDVFGSYDRPYIANSGGLLVSTTPQTATVVDLYRDSTGNLFYVEGGQFVAYPHPESTTWCCGCESDLLTEIRDSNAQLVENTATSSLSTGSDAQIINTLPSNPTLPAGTKILLVANNSTSPITVTTSIGDMIVDPGTTGSRSVDESEPDLTITNIVDAGTAYSGENITINVVTRS